MEVAIVHHNVSTVAQCFGPDIRAGMRKMWDQVVTFPKWNLLMRGKMLAE